MAMTPVRSARSTHPQRTNSFDTTWALLLLALAVIVARVWRLDLAAFYKDDPRFLTAAAAQVTTGRWVAASPILGSTDLHFGPAIIWFYGVLQSVLGFAPVTLIAAMCALITGVQLWFAGAVARAFTTDTPSDVSLWSHLRTNERARLAAGCVVLLLATSPVQYIWARMAWDQLTMVVALAVIAILAGAPRLTVLRLVSLSVLLGIGLSSHPMITPLIVLIGGMVLLTAPPRRPPVGCTLAALALPGLLVNVPWFLYVWRSTTRSAASGIRAPMTGVGFVDRWLEIPMAIGSTDLQYYFDSDWPSVLAAMRLSPELTGIAGLVLCVFAIGVGAWTGLRSASAVPRTLVRLAVVASVLFPAFMAVLATGLHPHYQFPTIWIPLTLLAAAIATTSRSAVRHALVTLVLVCSALQAGVLVEMMRWVDAHDGTRGPHYGMTVGAQRAGVAAMCAVQGLSVVENRTAVADPALRYLLSVEPACAQRSIATCPGPTCSADADAPALAWSYVDGFGARAELHPRAQVPAAPASVTSAPPPRTPATSTH